MAGDWIKMRTNLDTDWRVIEMAGHLGIAELHVVGCLALRKLDFLRWVCKDTRKPGIDVLKVKHLNYPVGTQTEQLRLRPVLDPVRQPVCGPPGLTFRLSQSRSLNMVTDEIFRPVVGFCGYSVSNLGRVRSDRTQVRGRYSLRSHRPRILAQHASGKHMNYLFVTLSVDGVAKRKKVAHLVAEAFIGPRPRDCDVDHISGDTKDNRLCNLRYLSASVNRGNRHG